MKRVFISGAAAGIGLATARQFAAAGYAVGIGDINADALAQATADIGPSSQGFALDVREPQQWQAALQAFCGEGGTLDVLINNAGILYAGRVEQIPFEQHARLIDINTKGVIAGSQAALPYLRRSARARVLNLCSASAIYGQPSIASYSASKFFVRGWTEALNIEWADYGIKVCSVWPIFVATRMVADAPDMKAASKMGVSLKPEDVAAALFKLAQQRKPPVHTPVGMQTHIFQRFVGVAPTALVRRIVAYLADYRG